MVKCFILTRSRWNQTDKICWKKLMIEEFSLSYLWVFSTAVTNFIYTRTRARPRSPHLLQPQVARPLTLIKVKMWRWTLTCVLVVSWITAFLKRSLDSVFPIPLFGSGLSSDSDPDPQTLLMMPPSQTLGETKFVYDFCRFYRI